MSYPINLLSRRQKGKFAASWLASTNSEASFKKLYTSDAIKKMNVEQMCNDILEVIQPSNGKSNNRFSLYLSSQLMSGITKIHSYQVEYYEKEIFKFEQNLEPSASSKKKGDKLDDFRNIECPDVELPKDFFSTHLLREDLHILPEDQPYDALQIVMRDAERLNFGCLNDEELELFLYNDNISLEERNILEKSTDITIAEEIYRHSSQENLSPVLVNISNRRTKSKGNLSLTPQKRQPQIQPETPTKKRRLSFATMPLAEDVAVPLVKDIAVPFAEDLAISAPELPAEKTGMLVSSQQTDMELESLNSSYFVINKQSKKHKIIDKEIVLTEKQLWKWRGNVNIHSKKIDKPKKRLISAINLLKEPSYLSKQWNTSLRNLFVDHITGPFMSVDEDVAPAEFVQFQEAIRIEETINKQNLMEDLSTFVKTDTAIAAEPIDSIVNVLPMPIAHADVSVPPLQEVIPHMITLEEGIRRDQEKLRSISNMDESLEDINALLERQSLGRHPSKSILGSPATSSNGTLQPELTSKDILAQLEVFWFNEPCVKFSQLIPKDTFTAEDAADAFNILLELHAQKKLILQQAECFRTLRIWKMGKLN
ncbi:Meiotic recombination protein REC8 like protein [Trachymyrmex septentrionalis]|uniref:Meiotic recombination protein REC8 like protein n=1 Tax=Trachymyrmex septentrionalis TaxID=34720 RepID=A0A195F037_9HYME|nr:Meiotic recombination protein REC8 like protein [Trachymyrmex septentrionalis]